MLFIAELGINHGGNVGLAQDMIISAKAAGADIAKFQMYDPIKILGKDSPHLEEATQAQFTHDQHKQLKIFCGYAGIEYCCSVFHAEDVPFFEEIGMQRYKIASRSTKEIALLEAIRRTGKPVIASNGLDKELIQLKAIFQPESNLSVLECICKYPTTSSQMALNIDYIDFDKPNSGLSSHCLSIVPSLTAIMYGAEIIEHHVRFDWQRVGCDMGSSITFEQFKQMTEIARNELC